MYIGINENTGIEISEDDALAYASYHCGLSFERHTPLTDEAKSAFVDWYFSGNWVKEGV